MPFDPSQFQKQQRGLNRNSGTQIGTAIRIAMTQQGMNDGANTPPPPPANTGGGGTGSGGSDPNQTIPQSQQQTNGGTSLQYPPDLGDYYFQLNFMKYHRPDPTSNASTVATGAVSLPIPDNLNEGFNIAYEDKALGLLGNIADNFGRKPGTGPQWSREQLVAAGYEAVHRGADDITNFVSGLFNQQVGSKLDTIALTGIADQYIGATPNPSMAVLFGGVGFRRHQFVWTFAPKNSSESDLIKSIRNFILQRSLPAFAAGVTNILDYPDMILPKLYPWGQADDRSAGNLQGTQGSSTFTDTYMYAFKKCVIDSVNLDYNPTGTPAFFAGTKAPAFVKMVLNMREIEYFTSDDFGGVGSNLQQQIANGGSQAMQGFGSGGGANTGG